MASRRLPTHGGIVTPIALDATHRADDAVAITSPGDVTIASVPQSGDTFEPCGNPVKLIFTGEFREGGGAARLVTLKLFRDGTEVAAADRYIQHIAANTREIIAVHWFDQPSPSNPSPDYSVVATADGAGAVAVNRRFTAFV